MIFFISNENIRLLKYKIILFLNGSLFFIIFYPTFLLAKMHQQAKILARRAKMLAKRAKMLARQAKCWLGEQECWLGEQK